MSCFLYKYSKERREETKWEYFRGIGVITTLSGLLLILGIRAIIIVMQNFSGWLTETTAEKLKYIINTEKVYVRKAEMHS